MKKHQITAENYTISFKKNQKNRPYLPPFLTTINFVWQILLGLL